MEDGAKELISLLRAFVNEVPLTREEVEGLDAVIPQVLHFCRLHNVTGIWAYKIREYYEKKETLTQEETEVLSAAQNIYSRTISQAVKRELQYQRLSKAMADKGIDHLAFKGIVVKNVYAVPQLRSYGDIDLAIRQEDRACLHTLMGELGYHAIIDYEPVYTYKKEYQMYEVHTSVMSSNITDRADYIGYFQNFWQYAVEQDPHVWSFTPEFHFVYLLSHIAKHIYSSGAGLRMYLDLAFYMKNLGDTLDWKWIQDEIAKLKMTEFFFIALDAVARWFGVKPSIEVPETEDTLFRQFEVFTMEGGVFGFEGRPAGAQLVRKQGKRSKALQRIWFPSIKSIQVRYTYLQKYPWMLPVAWVERFFRNQKKIGQIAVKTSEIIYADQTEIQKTKEFYRRIGL